MTFLYFLKAILRVVFKPKINIGDILVFDEFTENPFNKPHKVEVLAIKSGYVNYKFLNSRFFQNESMGISSFQFCYKKES